MTFPNDRSQWLSILGASVDIPGLSDSQLETYTTMTPQARFTASPDLFDQNGNIRQDANQVNAGSLVVQNSAAATAVGAISGKFQVFDANGNSLGYVPLYATIT